MHRTGSGNPIAYSEGTAAGSGGVAAVPRDQGTSRHEAIGGCALTAVAAVRLRGRCDVTRLQQAMKSLAAHHPLLCESTIQKRLPSQVELHALSSSEPAAIEQGIRAWLTCGDQTHRESSQAPLWRICVLDTPEQPVLLLAAQPILCGGSTNGTALLRALLAEYEGRPAVQSGDTMRTASTAQRTALFESWLASAPPLLDLPTDEARTRRTIHRAEVIERELPASLWHALTDHSRMVNVERPLLLQVALHALLHRYSGQSDLITAIQLPAPSDTVSVADPGLLLLRSHVEEDTTLFALTEKMQQDLALAKQHAPLPYAALSDRLGADRDRAVPFQVLCDWTATEPSVSDGNVLVAEWLNPPIVTLPCDLVIRARSDRDRLLIQIAYSAELFASQRIARLLDHLEIMVRSLVCGRSQQQSAVCSLSQQTLSVCGMSQPIPSLCGESQPSAAVCDRSLRISEVALLTETEYSQIVVDWNQTAHPVPNGLCIHHLFEAQAERTPSAPAVICGEETLSYRALQLRAHRLAARLRSLGVGPDVLVGICLPRSNDMAVAVLGILFAGGAYVPLDPTYPAQRLAFLCEDTQTPVLLTTRALRSCLPSYSGQTLCIDELDLTSEETDCPAPLDSVKPEHLGYVIYTSGSTGNPKGICLSHAALVNLICWHDRTLLRSARTLQFASLSFDASFHELFAALCSGGSVYFITETLRRNVDALTHFIADKQIEKVILPVVVLQQMAELFGDRPALFASLKEITTTGEQLHITQPIKDLFQKLVHCTFHNHYGPSETHVVTAMTMTGDPQRWPSHPPIGKPIDNSTVYILDRARNPVPIGVIGELYLGGVCLARSYLRRPELTQERFVANPFVPEPSAKMYKTGDLARYLPDGNIEFLGRIDHQVKIRGFRVELGEIESVLGRHPQVQEVVVLAREDTPGNKRLVAYVKPLPDGLITATTLRMYLQPQLPDYLIPAAFVILTELPLTSNGKVDRRALPVPSSARPQLEQEYISPKTATEAKLVSIVRSVLQLDDVGVRDHFFELGYDSLCAVQVYARIRDVFQVEIPFQRLFTTPTVAELASIIEAAQHTAPQPAAIAPIERTTLLPLSFAQERMWFLHRLAPDSPAYHCHYAFRLHGKLDLDALSQSLSLLIARHEVLRTTFEEHEGQPMQRIQEASTLSLAQLDLRTLRRIDQEADIHSALRQAAQARFDLEHGPLLRAGVIWIAQSEQIFWLTLHHIITDGRSMEVLFRELSSLYRGRAQGTTPQLAAQPIQYVDYAAWDRIAHAAEALHEHRAFWQDKLRDVPSLFELPSDHPRPAQQRFKGKTLRLRLGTELTKGLKQLGAQHRATLSMVLLAGLSALSHRYTGQDRFLLGIPSVGRDRVETENLIGFFVNILPIVMDFRARPSFSQLLSQVRQEVIDAFAHDSMPFERLVQELQIPRSVSHNPLIQVALAPQPPHERDLQLGNLSVQRIEVESHRAAFDLTVYVWEDAADCELNVEYSTDLFEEATVSRMVSHLQQILAAAVQNPQQAIRTTPLLPDAERDFIVKQLAQGERSTVPSLTFHELFSQQASRTPQREAVVETESGGRVLTYAQLEEASNQLARHLREKGIGTERLVALFVERSVDAIIAILATLKAGGAYVPLDPEYPANRLAFMLADAKPQLVISSAALRNRTGIATTQTLYLDEEWPQIKQHSAAPLPSLSKPHDLAYVIYTSGSTGQPKGVAIEHHSLTNLTVTQRAAFGITEAMRVLQFASLCFDASVSEIATTLSIGATLCLLPKGTPTLGAELAKLIETQRISLVTLPPSVAMHLPIEPCHGLTTLVVAGEASSPQLVSRWAPGRRVINAYGPTECTVCATLGDCHEADSVLTIGKPLGNVRVYVLDAEQQPVPIGVPGELYIAGAGVGRGYLHRPALTESRFVDVQIADLDRQRMYRTGDLVRWLSDGRIEFLGRLDQQVKIHGLRIELGEIESALAQDPQVAQAVVVAHETEPGEKELCAYIVPSDAAALDTQSGKRPLELWPSIAEYFVYDDVIYYALSSDERRNQVYRKSLRRCVVDKVVLEIGTGAEAVLARMCIEEGARKVYAIEILEESYRKAKQRIADLGLTDRIEVILGDAIHVSLPELADVCVSEIVGAIGGSEAAAYIMNRARHLLSPTARIVPERSVTRIAALTLPDEVLDSPAFTPIAAHYTRKIFAQIGRPFELRLCLRGVDRSQLLSDVGVFEDLDFRVPTPLEETHSVRLHIEQAGALSGFLVWLNLYTLDEDCIDILDHEYSWIPVFLPVFGQNIHVPTGTVIDLQIARTLCDNGRNPDYQLRGQVLFPDGTSLPISYTATHYGTEAEAGVFRNPFYAKLFANGQIAERAAPSDVVESEAAESASEREQRLSQRLHTQLGKRLPKHMIPTDFVFLQALPLAPTGKVDRRALPRPQRQTVEQPVSDVMTPLQQKVAALWKDLLKVPSVKPSDHFFESGGHSLLAARLLLRIQDALGVEVSLRALYDSPTLAGLVQHIIKVQSRSEGSALCFRPDLSLEEEAQLPLSIAATDHIKPLSQTVEHIFLTGATGYVGAFLLSELIAQTDSRVQIHCLVRGQTEAEARRKLIDSQSRYGLWKESSALRIQIVQGDLGAPRFGLSDEAFVQLAEQIDLIVHCGAKVDHVRGYDAMKPANVTGTQTVLALASLRKLKPVHHMSTLSVLYPPQFLQRGVVSEDDVAGPLQSLPNGYMQSKCVAEHQMLTARSRGIPVAIYRLGAISGDSDRSVCNIGDYFYSALRTSAQLGHADNLNTDQTLVPVNHAARAVVALALRSASLGKTFHICPEEPFMWFDLMSLLTARGYPIKLVSFRDCMNVLRDAAREGSDAPMVAFIPFLFQKHPATDKYVLEDYYADIRYSSRHTVEGLHESGSAQLPSPRTFVEKYIDYLQKGGYLPTVTDTR